MNLLNLITGGPKTSISYIDSERAKATAAMTELQNKGIRVALSEKVLGGSIVITITSHATEEETFDILDAKRLR